MIPPFCRGSSGNTAKLACGAQRRDCHCRLTDRDCGVPLPDSRINSEPHKTVDCSGLWCGEHHWIQHSCSEYRFHKRCWSALHQWGGQWAVQPITSKRPHLLRSDFLVWSVRFLWHVQCRVTRRKPRSWKFRVDEQLLLLTCYHNAPKIKGMGKPGLRPG